MVNEVSAGIEASRYSRTSTGLPANLPATSIAEIGQGFGWADETDFENEVLAFQVRETIHHHAGAHRLKYGASALFPSYNLTWDRDEAGRFVFPSVADFLQRRGWFRLGAGDDVFNADYSLRHFTFFAQDSWRAAPGLDLLVGVRYTLTRWPDFRSIRHDFDWEALTGMVNVTIPQRPGHFEPVAGFTWAPGGAREWLLRGFVVMDGHTVSPDLVAEIFSNSGRVDIFSGIGNLGSWPDPPDTVAAPNRGHTLSILGPKFRGPTTTRFTGSIARSLGIASLELSGTLRETAYLPKRRDINRLPDPTARDQHGRPVYGQLSKVGELVTSDPGTSRRLIEYERVWAVEAAGRSTYRGLTVSLRRPLIDAVGLFASWTASRTEDDWPGAGGNSHEAQLSPFPDSLEGTDWADARSDLDVPNRLVVGVERRVPGRFGPHITGLYRHQSGYPFTPGFRDGVDVNGDGSGLNDPAFVDPQIAGTGELAASWPCLQEQLGRFAERNSCRGPSLNALDARLSLELARGDRYSAHVVVDALNLLSSDLGEVDRALYLIDPASPLGGDQITGTVAIPYVVNPRFGEIRTRYAPQRVLRLGVRVSY